MNIAAIIQVRTSSTRLPKKVLMKINGISIIESILAQLSYSKLLTKKIIATTNDVSDNILIDIASNYKLIILEAALLVINKKIDPH